VLSKLEYQVLSACADGYEVFYFLFAEVNYGGQVFERAGDGVPENRTRSSGSWVAHVEASELIAAIESLIQEGLLTAWRIDKHDVRERLELFDSSVSSEYDQYRCITFDEHLDRSGYGPHEFKATEAGIAAMRLAETQHKW
jgi:hypothetical protein